MKFKYLVRVKGKLQSSFVFQDAESLKSWLASEYKELIKKYGKLTYFTEELPELSIGDTCNVYGEGADQFTITGIEKYAEHRYGFILDGCTREDVAKCHRKFI